MPEILQCPWCAESQAGTRAGRNISTYTSMGTYHRHVYYECKNRPKDSPKKGAIVIDIAQSKRTAEAARRKWMYDRMKKEGSSIFAKRKKTNK